MYRINIFLLCFYDFLIIFNDLLLLFQLFVFLPIQLLFVFSGVFFTPTDFLLSYPFLFPMIFCPFCLTCSDMFFPMLWAILHGIVAAKCVVIGIADGLATVFTILYLILQTTPPLSAFSTLFLLLFLLRPAKLLRIFCKGSAALCRQIIQCQPCKFLQPFRLYLHGDRLLIATTVITG